MTANNKSRKLFAALLATITVLTMMFALAIPAFATETGAPQETTDAGTTAPAIDTTEWIINLSVAGVLVIAIVVLAIVFRKRIPGWWKALKSECKKIVWCPKDKLKKNSFVVIILIIILTAVIAVLDFTFLQGLDLLRGLFK